MTDDELTPAELSRPDSFQRGLFIASLAVLFMAILLWLVVFVRPFTVVYEQLGMTELPWVTEFAMTIANGAALVLPVAAVALLLWGVIAMRRATRRTMNRMTAVNFIVAALMPGFVYLSVFMPIVELQRKLAGGS